MYMMYIRYRRHAMDSMNTTDARENLAEVLNRVAYAKDRVRITRRGKEVAAVVPIEDLELIERIENEVDVREARKALAESQELGTIPWEDVKKELGL
jgi:prevent-host-death family protein